MTNDQDKATIRFAVIEKDGKYQVIDTVTGKSLRFNPHKRAAYILE